jgi:acyl carrier protein
VPSLEDELKRLIIETLQLEDISPADIKDDEPLFVTGLGLDSIDALELGVAIRRRYGVQFSADPAQSKRQFASVRALADFIGQSRPHTP